MKQLRLWGVSHLLVHWKQLREQWQRAAFHRLAAEGEIALERTIGRFRIYRILPRQ